MQRCSNNSNLNLNLISLKINNKHSVITTKKKKYSKLIFLILRKHPISLRGKQEYKRTKNLDVKSHRPEPRSFNRVHKLLAQSSDIGHYDHKMYAWVWFFIRVHVFLCISLLLFCWQFRIALVIIVAINWYDLYMYE